MPEHNSTQSDHRSPNTADSAKVRPASNTEPGLIIGIFAAGALVFLGGIWLRCTVDNPPSGPDLANALMTLGSGVILGGGVKYLLDRYQQKQKERDEHHELRERLLAELRDVYLRTETARLTLKSVGSTSTYTEKMRELIGCQAALLRIKRSLDLRTDEAGRERNQSCFVDIVGYLRALQNEFAENIREMPVGDGPWGETINTIASPVLHDLATCGERFRARFSGPLYTLANEFLQHGVPTNQDQEMVAAIPDHDRCFDKRVEGTARSIRDVCAASPKV
jgi:hypothetical protein